MARFALTIAYDGSHFDGWQTQPSGRTVQDTLEHSLSIMAGHEIKVVCAGRTDAGVHALAQVIHFDTHSERPLNAWVRGVNARLPSSVSVLSAVPVEAEFHARYSASRRHYTYLIHCAPVRHPLFVERVGWVHQPLDANAMRAASRSLVGEHDFSAFRAAQCQAKSPVRRVERLDLVESGAIVSIHISANAFLHHMVRNIVGALLAVGMGRQPVGWVETLLASRDRSRGAPTFTGAGLYLAGVDYDERFGLSASASQDPSWIRVLSGAAGRDWTGAST